MKTTLSILITLLISSCTTTNKIPIQYNKYGGIHMVKYKEIEGKIYVRGKEVTLLKERFIFGNAPYSGNSINSNFNKLQKAKHNIPGK